MKKLFILSIAMGTLNFGTNLHASDDTYRLSHFYSANALKDGSWITTDPNFDTYKNITEHIDEFVWEEEQTFKLAQQANTNLKRLHDSTRNWKRIAHLGIPISADNVTTPENKLTLARMNALYTKMYDYRSRHENADPNIFRPEISCYTKNTKEENANAINRFNKELKQILQEPLQGPDNIQEAQVENSRWKTRGILTATATAVTAVGIGAYLWMKTKK